MRKNLQKRDESRSAPSGVQGKRPRGRPRKNRDVDERKTEARPTGKVAGADGRGESSGAAAPAPRSGSPRGPVTLDAAALPENVTLGASPIHPTALPPMPESEHAGDAPHVDETPPVEAPPPPVFTAEMLVETCEELQVIGGLAFCASSRREWSAETVKLCSFTAEQRARLLVFAPSALPYLSFLADSRFAGVALFSFALLRSGAEMFGRLRALPQTPETTDEPGRVHDVHGEPGEPAAASTNGFSRPNPWHDEK